MERIERLRTIGFGALFVRPVCSRKVIDVEKKQPKENNEGGYQARW